MVYFFFSYRYDISFKIKSTMKLHCTLHTAHHTPHTTHRTPHTAHRTPHTAHRTPHTTHHTPHTAHRTPKPHTAHRTPHTAHRTPHTAHRTPHTTHRTLHTTHRTLHTALHRTLHSPTKKKYNKVFDTFPEVHPAFLILHGAVFALLQSLSTTRTQSKSKTLICTTSYHSTRSSMFISIVRAIERINRAY